MGEIKTLFEKLDANGNGSLTMDEMKGVVSRYNGEGVDEKQFMEWYDCRGERDGKVSLMEFSWYLADVALSFGEREDAKKALPGVIDLFSKLDEEVDAAAS